MRLANVLAQDIRFQLRHGFYTAYLILTVIYVLLLLSLPSSVRGPVTSAIVFTDTGVMGFFFIGGLIILEKGQHIFDSLFVTTMQMTEYLLSKLLSLTLISTIVGLIIFASANGWNIRLWDFIMGNIFCCLIFTSLGIGIAVKARNVNEYFIASLGISLLMMFPLLDFFNVVNSKWFYLFPTIPILHLLNMPFSAIPIEKIELDFAILVFWTALFYWWANMRFRKYIILKVGKN